jgi:hypothetical protein
MSNSSYSDNLRRTIEEEVGRVQHGAQSGADRVGAPLARFLPWRLIAVVVAVIVGIVAACAGVLFIFQDELLHFRFNGGLLRNLTRQTWFPNVLVVLIAVTIIAVGLIWFARSRGRLQQSTAASATLPTTAIAGQITRLEQLRDWMTEDKAFAQLVDSMIGRQVQAAEARQTNRAIVITVVTSVLSLAAGWLLTAVSPGALAALFAR